MTRSIGAALGVCWSPRSGSPALGGGLMKPSVGLLGVATYLPPQARGNDWWPRATAERWLAARGAPPRPAPGELTPAMERVIAAMAEQAIDPFQGVVERRVMPDGMAAVDMEA